MITEAAMKKPVATIEDYLKFLQRIQFQEGCQIAHEELNAKRTTLNCPFKKWHSGCNHKYDFGMWGNTGQPRSNGLQAMGDWMPVVSTASAWLRSYGFRTPTASGQVIKEDRHKDAQLDRKAQEAFIRGDSMEPFILAQRQKSITNHAECINPVRDKFIEVYEACVVN